MPRSFLVKKHINSAKKPNYSELESPTGKFFFLRFPLNLQVVLNHVDQHYSSDDSLPQITFHIFQSSSRRTSTRASPCPSFPSRRSWARQPTAPSQCGLPVACRCPPSPVTSPPSLDTRPPSPTPPPKTTAARRAREAMKTSRCCPSWQTLTEWRQRSFNVVCAANPTPRTLDCSSTNSCTATPKRGNPSAVNTARRSTSAWELSKCTSGLTRCLVFVKYAGRLSPDRGCSKDTSGRTRVSGGVGLWSANAALIVVMMNLFWLRNIPCCTCSRDFQYFSSASTQKRMLLSGASQCTNPAPFSCLTQQVRSRFPALTATERLQTGPISGLTYRPIRMWKSTNARTAPKPSLGCLFFTSMRNLVVV